MKEKDHDRYRQALEGLRERCAQEAERITARSRTLAAMINTEAVKPCEVAAAIRKIDVQQYYECVAKLGNVRPGKHQHPICSQAQPLTDEVLLRQALRAEVERDKALLRQALEALTDFFNAYPHMAKGYTEGAIAALRERLSKGA